MKMHPLRVAMPPHGLIFGGNEAYGLQDAFGSVPGPPGRQKRTQNEKIDETHRKIDFCRFFGPYVSFKGDKQFSGILYLKMPGIQFFQTMPNLQMLLQKKKSNRFQK